MRWLIIVALVLTGCDVARPPKVLECNIATVSGTFETTERELNASGDLVTMYRGTRMFMWPRDRITACREVIE